MKKRLKVGLKKAGGPEPGYLWSVHFLVAAEDESNSFLRPDQHRHLVDQIRALAYEPDPARAKTVRVESINEYFELKDKGGPFGKINVRVYFSIDRDSRRLLILGTLKKEKEGKTPLATQRLMSRRLRKYRAGDYGI